jgi:hypothetical protein
MMQHRSFVKESLEYVNKANAAHKEQVSCDFLHHRCPCNAKEQLDRDFERAKAGLDAIESAAQIANDARMLRIKKAVKTGNLYAVASRAFLSFSHVLQ